MLPSFFKNWFRCWSGKIIPDTPACSLFSAGGRCEVKEVNHTGSGAGSTDNIFQITGLVKVLELTAEITENTDDTTFGDWKLETDDGAAQVALCTIQDLSGVATVGKFFVKDQDDGDPLSLLNAPNAAGYYEPAAGVQNVDFQQGFLFAKTGATSYVRANYEGDGTTDIKIKYVMRWAPLNSTGNVEAV